VSPGSNWSAWSSSATVWGPRSCSACHVGAVGVALDRPEEPGRWIGELPQQGTGRDRRFIASDDLLQRLGRCAR